MKYLVILVLACGLAVTAGGVVHTSAQQPRPLARCVYMHPVLLGTVDVREARGSDTLSVPRLLVLVFEHDHLTHPADDLVLCPPGTKIAPSGEPTPGARGGKTHGA